MTGNTTKTQETNGRDRLIRTRTTDQSCKRRPTNNRYVEEIDRDYVDVYYYCTGYRGPLRPNIEVLKRT